MITIEGSGLTIDDIASVARGAPVAITTAPSVLGRVRRSRQVIQDAVSQGQQVYGVTTLFGGMAGIRVGTDQLRLLQKVALWHHKSTTGPRLPNEDVRAAMLLRANTLMRGASGVRQEIIDRFALFLNANACPLVYRHGSIGASGDLVPLSYIAGAIVGLHPEFKVELEGQTLDCHRVLERLGLQPIELEPKEGLALNNGTSACTGVAALCTHRAFDLTALGLGIHALMAQALRATDQSFHPFLHEQKPHPGQRWAAGQMAALLKGSAFIRAENHGDRSARAGELIQDRYSLRCLPQYLGPIVDTLGRIAAEVEVEANSATDNPLIDPDTGEIFHGGNFLGQYVGVAMDHLRHQIGMLAKHLDAQIALLVTPAFSNGLPACLVGTSDGVNVGFKSSQVVGNALMPLISFYGQPIVDRFPTHADQFNQNINSQAMNAANLARESLDLLEHYLANALVMAIQAVEIRSAQLTGRHDATALLSPATRALYRAARIAARGAPNDDAPLLREDLDTFIQPMVEGLLVNLASVLDAVSPVRSALRTRTS